MEGTPIKVSYRIKRHPLIGSDLDDMFTFLADFAGFDIAEAKISQINRRIEELAEFPQIGTVRNEIHPRLRVLTATGRDVVCFTTDLQAKEVLVVLIGYAGADWTSRIKNRL